MNWGQWHKPTISAIQQARDLLPDFETGPAGTTEAHLVAAIAALEGA